MRRSSAARQRTVREDHAGRWMPPAAWLAMALLAGPYLAAWAWMWLIAIALFAGCKWATWWPLRFEGTPRRRAAFLVGHVGMDARHFILGAPVPPPTSSAWTAATIRTLAGATLTWLVARQLVPVHPYAAAWVAMVGMVMLLHFGLFDLLALAWRARGIDAQPLMRQPSRAISLADFWGRRWNTGFHALAHELVFVPLKRDPRFGATGATVAVFLASSAVHDLVISLPSRGGYGLPTLYFLTQLAAMLIERTPAIRRAVHAHPLLGRLLTMLIVVAPLPLLFHRPFIVNVIAPFLHTIGALS